MDRLVRSRWDPLFSSSDFGRADPPLSPFPSSKSTVASAESNHLESFCSQGLLQGTMRHKLLEKIQSFSEQIGNHRCFSERGSENIFLFLILFFQKKNPL